MNKNLCKTVLENKGTLVPLIISSKDTQGLGLMNPSILNDNGRILVNLRSINYTLYHSEAEQRFNQRWGPLSYLNPENDVKLKTRNFICILNDKLEIEKHFLVDTTKLDKNPVWEFHGLEDARLIKWNERLYICGVRRDVKENGEGRMELSEIILTKNSVKEISRFRIPDPSHEKTAYCNKNWVPILAMPYHFIKWTNPTEIVKVNPKKKTCKVIFSGKERLEYTFDFRGGSQVIRWGKYRLSLIHETCIFKNRLNQKDARYLHRFVVWGEKWNIVHISETFSFMTAMIEFSCGMCFYKNDLLITFGFQDNVSYLLRIPEKIIDKIIGFTNKNLDYGRNKLFLGKMIDKEIFDRKIYEKYYQVKKNDIVMDIGANIGAFTYSILDKKPKHVYCIEPSKILIETLVKNIKGQFVTIIDKAISETNEMNKEIKKGIFIYSCDKKKYDTITFKKVISDNKINRIDFLKIDCEGGEYDIFTKENKSWISSNVKNIAAEFHLWGVPDAVNNFIKFRNLYLKQDILLNGFEVIITKTGQPVKDKIFDNDFLHEFSDSKTHSAQLMIYFRYE